MEIVKLFWEPIAKVLPHIPGAILNLLIGLIIIKIATVLVRRGVKVLKIPHDLRGIIITLSKLFMWLFLIIFIVSQLGLGNLAVLISGSAVILVFFLNTTAGPLLSDIFAGLFLIGDPDFTVGMRVRVNDDKTEGIIKGIDMRKVRILDDKGMMHIVPNSVIEKGVWTVLERKAK
jgi:small-conductance mechanosensitive channel